MTTPTPSELSNQASAAIGAAMKVSEFRTPTGMQVKLPSAGDLLDAKRRLDELAAGAGGGGAVEQIRLARLDEMPG